MVQGSVCLARGRYHGFVRRMKLKAKVKTTRKATSGASCQEEMSAVMGCWRRNAFEDTACTKEIERFLVCAAQAQENPAEHKAKGKYEWTSREVNERLRRFVWPQ